MRPRWSRAAKLTVIIFIALLVAYLLYRFSAIIPPLVIAMLLAYILTPLADGLAARFRWPRTLAVIAIYIVLLAFGLFAPLLLIPELLRQAQALRAEFGDLRQLVQTPLTFGGLTLDLAPLFENASASTNESLRALISPAFNLLLNAAELIAFSIAIVVVSFYLVKDGRKVVAVIDHLTPPAYREDVRRLRAEINVVWGAFLRGQVILALVVAVIWSVAGFTVGLRFSLALGLLAGLLEFLPSIGHGIFFVISVTVALVNGSAWLPVPPWAFALIVVGLNGLFQQADLNYLIPRIIGQHVNLPPLLIILGIIGGAALAGILGIALAAPTIATARIVGRYLYAGLFDLDPFVPIAHPEATP